ncbi:TPA: hypothetical protein EYN98_17560 [Candidatus Poribacteria bacterium]|nr:hypothetical protein [Candidatus Poribacteria bacterium]
MMSGFCIRFLCILLLLFLGCFRKIEQADFSDFTAKVEFFQRGAKIHFPDHNRKQVQRVSVFNVANNQILAELDLGGLANKTESVYFRWSKDQNYQFRFEGLDGEQTWQVHTASDLEPRGSIRIGVPYPDANPSKSSLILYGSEAHVSVMVENGFEAPINFRIEIETPFTSPIIRQSSFVTGFEVWHDQFRLKIPDEFTSPDTKIVGRVFFENPDGKKWTRSSSIELRLVSIQAVAEQISIEEILMPTDANGTSNLRQRPDAIKLPANRERHNAYIPIAFQTVRIRNQHSETIHAVVSSINRDVRTNKAISFLTPPNEIGPNSNQSFAIISLAGESVTDIVLPFYLNPSSKPRTGHYKRDIKIKVWGNKTPVLSASYPLEIIKPNIYSLATAGIATVVAGFGLIGLVRFHQKILSFFSTKELVLTALFATTIFVTVSVPTTLFFTIINALLGPASFLVIGFINEILYYALLTALIMLIQKPWTITLVSAVRVLLGGILLGAFTPFTLVYVGISTILLELGFLLSGQGRNGLILALTFGVCDALSVYINFQISIAFYRLFYASWYIWTMIVISGFAYTVIGVLLGKRIGLGLQAITE